MEAETQSCCIICYKNISESSNEESYLQNQEKSNVLKRFFDLLERYSGNGGESLSTVKSLIGKLIDNGIVGACEDCFKTVESFCGLYHDMKTIELLMDWKVWEFKNILQHAEESPDKKEGLREAGLKPLEFNQVMEFKRNLGINCSRKLSQSYPVLKLNKVQILRKSDGEKVESYQQAESPKLQMMSYFIPPSTQESNPQQQRRIHTVSMLANQLPVSTISVQQSRSACSLPISSSKTRFSCDLCNKTFAQRWILKDHKKTIHEGLVFKCGYCSFTSMHRSNLCTHIKLNHTNPTTGVSVPFKMMAVDRNIRNLGNVKYSSVSENSISASQKKKVYSCNICNRRFNYAASLYVHKQATHEGIRYKCGYCSRVTTQAGNLKTHIRSHHQDCSGQALPYKTTIFKLNSSKQPTMSVKGSGSVKTISPISFGEVIIVGSNIISNATDFKVTNTAPVVLKQFQGSNILSNQLDTEMKRSNLSNNKPSCCNICNKQFSHPTGLSRHKKAEHQGHHIRYSCGYCPYFTAQRFNLQTHIKKIHKDPVTGVHLPFKINEVIHRKMETAEEVNVSVNEERIPGATPEAEERYDSKHCLPTLNEAEEEFLVPLSNSDTGEDNGLGNDDFQCKEESVIIEYVD